MDISLSGPPSQSVGFEIKDNTQRLDYFTQYTDIRHVTKSYVITSGHTYTITVSKTDPYQNVLVRFEHGNCNQTALNQCMG